MTLTVNVKLTMRSIIFIETDFPNLQSKKINKKYCHILRIFAHGGTTKYPLVRLYNT